jgi:CRP-like cAMP-binding protein
MEIFRGDEPPASFHVVVRGEVRAQGCEYGEERIGEGGTLGLITLLSRAEGGLTATAETDTVTLEVAEDDLHDVFEDNFTILHNEMQNLAHGILIERREVPHGTYLARREARPLEQPVREMDLIDRLLHLQEAGMFRQSNVDALVEMARSSVTLNPEPGAVLWRAGDPSGSTIILIEGVIRCAVQGGERWFRAGPGYPLGNIESTCGEPRWYDAVTEMPVLALQIDADVLTDILEDHFGMALEVLAALAGNLIRIRAGVRGTLSGPAGRSEAEAPADARRSGP